jgi:hypothetical protein
MMAGFRVWDGDAWVDVGGIKWAESEAAADALGGVVLLVKQDLTLITLTTWQVLYWASRLNLSDDDAVTEWPDVSGFGHDASQETAANQPSFVAEASALNDRPAVAFDGDSALEAPTIDVDQPLGVFIVLTAEAHASSARRIVSTTEGEIWQQSDAGGIRITYNDGSTTTTLIDTATSPVCCIINLSGANSGVLRLNGVETVEASGTTNDGLVDLMLGNRPDLARGFIGEIAVFGVKGDQFTSDEIEELEAWAEAYYGITFA